MGKAQFSQDQRDKTQKAIALRYCTPPRLPFSSAGYATFSEEHFFNTVLIIISSDQGNTNNLEKKQIKIS